MNTTAKSDILSLITTDLGVSTTSQFPDSPQEENTKTCVLIDDHALVQSTGKPHDCHTFNEYADHFIGSLDKHLNTLEGLLNVWTLCLTGIWESNLSRIGQVWPEQVRRGQFAD